MLSDFDALYGARGSGRNAGIDAAYSPPARFVHAEMARVARFAARGDGQDVEVYEARWPASFWTIEALDTPHSGGVDKEGFGLSTGSGFEAGKLAFAIARAIAAGKLGLRDAPLAHAETARVAGFAGRGDGQDVEIYEAERGMAASWTIEAHDTPNSVGAVEAGFCLSTASGALAFAVAEAVSEGMLGLRQAN
jgi:hypothetical protein